MGDSVPEETKIRRLNDIIDLQRTISLRRNQVLILLLLAYAVVRVAIFVWRGI